MIATEEQSLIRDTARAFARDRLLPSAEKWDRDAYFPREILTEMGELGFLGMLMPEELGGCDTGYVAYAMALEEVAAGCGALSTVMSVHNSVACMPIFKYGTEEQKKFFLPKMTSGEWLGGFALTEPHAGSETTTC